MRTKYTNIESYGYFVDIEGQLCAVPLESATNVIVKKFANMISWLVEERRKSNKKSAGTILSEITYAESIAYYAQERKVLQQKLELSLNPLKYYEKWEVKKELERF